MLDQEFNSINPEASVWPHALRNGLIWALIAIVMQLVTYYTGTLEESLTGSYTAASIFSGLVSLLVSIWFVISAIRSYRAERGALTFGKAVSTGAATGLIYGLIAAVWTFVFFSFIFPDFQNVMQEMMYSQYEEAGMEEDQIEMAMDMASMFTSPAYMTAMSIVAGAIYGTIISLIAGIFMKTD